MAAGVGGHRWHSGCHRLQHGQPQWFTRRGSKDSCTASQTMRDVGDMADEPDRVLTPQLPREELELWPILSVACDVERPALCACPRNSPGTNREVGRLLTLESL